MNTPITKICIANKERELTMIQNDVTVLETERQLRDLIKYTEACRVLMNFTSQYGTLVELKLEFQYKINRYIRAGKVTDSVLTDSRDAEDMVCNLLKQQHNTINQDIDQGFKRILDEHKKNIR
tara:strand:- start:565 stop:933 length:369 start_codon:yes stop_codon:yes gene_type:complete